MIAFCCLFISISWSFFIFSSCFSSCFLFFSSMNSWCLASFSRRADSIFSRFSASLSILRKQILEWYSIRWHLKLKSTRVYWAYFYLIASFWSFACSCSSFFLFSLSMASIWTEVLLKKKFNMDGYNSPVIVNLYLKWYFQHTPEGAEAIYIVLQSSYQPYLSHLIFCLRPWSWVDQFSSWVSSHFLSWPCLFHPSSCPLWASHISPRQPHLSLRWVGENLQ